MKKTFVCAAAVAALSLALVACGGSASSSGSAGYSGTQTSSAAGMASDVAVTITWENGVVTACEVDASGETEGLGTVAGPQVGEAIVEANSPEVDAVSGATITSDAVIEAAKACFDAAGVSY